MKTIKILIAVMITTIPSLSAQTNSDSLGLQGDNLNLSAVLTIFKKSKNTEDFEKQLNAADNKINNLDLNHDGQVDYIRVIESGSGDNRSLILQDPISKSESQDVAVVQIEKQGNNVAHVQIVGDEALYGKNYIIEPQDPTQSAQPQNNNTPTPYNNSANNSSQQPSNNSTQIINNNYYGTPTGYGDGSYGNGGYVNGGYGNGNYGSYGYVNAWGWPVVSLMFAPSYSFWVSPYYWGYYPVWWNPWSPFGFFAYRNYMTGFGYYHYYHRSYYNRMGGAYSNYYSHRVYSPYVQKTIRREGSVNVRNGGGRFEDRNNRGINNSGHQEQRNQQSVRQQPNNNGNRQGNENRQGSENRQGGGERNSGGHTNGGQTGAEHMNGGHNNMRGGQMGGGHTGGGQMGGGHIGGGGHAGGGGRH